jgi:hypothetical protein
VCSAIYTRGARDSDFRGAPVEWNSISSPCAAVAPDDAERDG